MQGPHLTMKKCVQVGGLAVAPLRDTAMGLGIWLAFFACSPKTTSLTLTEPDGALTRYRKDQVNR